VAPNRQNQAGNRGDHTDPRGAGNNRNEGGKGNGRNEDGRGNNRNSDGRGNNANASPPGGGVRNTQIIVAPIPGTSKTGTTQPDAPTQKLPNGSLPTGSKKWCLKGVSVVQPVIEKWHCKDKTKVPVPVLEQSSYPLKRNTVVGVLKQDESSSWSGITYEETIYDFVDKTRKDWVTTRVTGWVNNADLDDYIEEFPNFKGVDIPNATKSSTDPIQNMTIVDEKYDEIKARHNMCGQLCVGFIVKEDIDPKSTIDDVLNKWRASGIKNKAGVNINYERLVGRDHDEGLVQGDLKEILALYYTGDVNRKTEPYKVGVNNITLAAKADDRHASDELQKKLLQYYFIMLVTINPKTGELIPLPEDDPKKRNHWVVVDRITRNGGRVELYNPSPNKRQSYTFNEFYKSVGSNPNSGWWVERKQYLKADDYEIPKEFKVAIDTPKNPKFPNDAEQYIWIGGNKKTRLCGEFCVAYILGNTIDKVLKNWNEKPPAGLGELSTFLKAYGYLKGTKSFSMETVLDYWKETQPKLYEYHVGQKEGKGENTNTRELKSILNAYGYHNDQKNNRADFRDFNEGLKSAGLLPSSPGRIQKMLDDYFLIAGVGIDDVTGRLIRRDKVRHWVVVEKIDPRGNLVGGNGGWVELYNPFQNRWEEYSYKEFIYSMDNKEGVWSGLWVKRDITPKFTSQDVLDPIIEEEGKKVRADAGKGKLDSDRWKKTKLLEMIQKKLKNMKPEAIPAVLKNSGWSVDDIKAEIKKLMPATEKVDPKPADDTEKTVSEFLGIKSIPSEIITLISKESNRNASLARDLASALHKIGVLSIDEKEKKAVINLDDPALPEVPRADIASFSRGITTSRQGVPAIGGGLTDKAANADELTQKIADVLRPIFAFQVKDAIENIRAVAAIDAILAKEKEEAEKKKGTNKSSLPSGGYDGPPPAYRVMWDWEIDGFEKIGRPNLPAVFRCGEISDNSNGHYTPLTREWQFFWFDLCCKIFYGRYHQDLTKMEYDWLANKWTSVGGDGTAFTNNHGLDTFRNYPLGERTKDDDPAIYTLVCGGASLAGTPVQFTKGKKKMWMLKVEHFDGTKSPPPVETIDPYTDPRVFFATNITNARVRDSGYIVKNFKEGTCTPDPKGQVFPEGYKVNPFPQFDGMDVPVPLIASWDIYYPMKNLVSIGTEKKAIPYFPQDPDTWTKYGLNSS